MDVLLVAGGAIVIFIAGLAAGRITMSRTDVPTVPPAPVPDSMHADVLERHPMGVVVASPTGSIEYRNPAATALGGTHVGVLLDEVIARHLETARSGEPSGETIELFGPPKRVLVVATQPMPGRRAVAFVEDITDRHRAAQARTDFVANVSHELRTPIGALIVLADTLVGTDDVDVIERVVGRMQREADRASRIVEHLLELSEIEAGVERDVRTVPLSDVVNDAIGRVAELAARSDIEIRRSEPSGADGPGDDRHVVNGDRARLVSAVGNVVENAVKYSEPGAVVRVDVRRVDGWGEIVVADEGVGIPRRDLDRVFERFYRVDRARSRNTGGTGLGLSIVRHVVNSHGGSVSVESVEGQGATFVLRLPLVAAPRAAGPPVESSPEREGIT